jgi:hypothetical protein
MEYLSRALMQDLIPLASPSLTSALFKTCCKASVISINFADWNLIGYKTLTLLQSDGEDDKPKESERVDDQLQETIKNTKRSRMMTPKTRQRHWRFAISKQGAHVKTFIIIYPINPIPQNTKYTFCRLDLFAATNRST